MYRTRAVFAAIVTFCICFLGFSAPASAQPTISATVYGTDIGIFPRTGPSFASSRAAAAVPDGTRFTVICETTGESVQGDDIRSNVWEKTSQGYYLPNAFMITGYDGFHPHLPKCGSSASSSKSSDAQAEAQRKAAEKKAAEKEKWEEEAQKAFDAEQARDDRFVKQVGQKKFLRYYDVDVEEICRDRGALFAWARDWSDPKSLFCAVPGQSYSNSSSSTAEFGGGVSVEGGTGGARIGVEANGGGSTTSGSGSEHSINFVFYLSEDMMLKQCREDIPGSRLRNFPQHGAKGWRCYAKKDAPN